MTVTVNKNELKLVLEKLDNVKLTGFFDEIHYVSLRFFSFKGSRALTN